MNKKYIVFNVIASLIFITIFFVSFIFVDDIIYFYEGNDWNNPISHKNITASILKIFSLSGLLIQFYFICKKINEK